MKFSLLSLRAIKLIFDENLIHIEHALKNFTNKKLSQRVVIITGATQPNTSGAAQIR